MTISYPLVRNGSCSAYNSYTVLFNVWNQIIIPSTVPRDCSFTSANTNIVVSMHRLVNQFFFLYESAWVAKVLCCRVKIFSDAYSYLLAKQMHIRLSPLNMSSRPLAHQYYKKNTLRSWVMHTWLPEFWCHRFRLQIENRLADRSAPILPVARHGSMF